MEYFEIDPDLLGVEMPPSLKRFEARMFLCFNAYDGEFLGVEYSAEPKHLTELRYLLRAKYKLDWDGLVARSVNVGKVRIYVSTTSFIGGNLVLRYSDIQRVERARLNDAIGL